MSRYNFAARAARWSAAHWKTAVAAWIAFVAVAIGLGMTVGTHTLSASEQSTGETARAEQILASAGFKTPAAESVLVRSSTRTIADPAFRSTVQDVLAKLRSMPQVANLRTGAAGEISKNRRAQLIEFDMKGELDTADARVQPLLDAVADLQKASPGFTIAEFGFASATHELGKTIDKDFQQAEKLSVPITFVILLLAFGAFVAAGVPVLLAFSAVLGSVGLSALASHAFHASDATQSVILLMGMAVGVDYSLFYLKREREERTAGHEAHEGLFRAAATSGQAVLISGFTVLIAMAGLLFAGTKIFTSIGIGAMLVVFTSLVGSLTVLPALLGKLGDRYIERGLRQVLAATVLRFLRLFRAEPRWLVWLRETPTLLQRLKGDRQESRLWGFVITRSMRRPALAVAVSTVLLVVLALPVLRIHTTLLSFTDLPKSLSIVKTYDTIQASFPGSQDPAHLVVKADDVTTPQFAKAYAQFKTRALATGVIHQPIRVSVNKAKTVARVDFPLAGEGQDATAVRALETLRTQVIPPVLATLPPGTQQAVTGDTAANVDFNQTMKSRAPIVFAFVLGFAFLLLLLTFRSIVIPIKAIILNLLSVGAAYGVLVWIFQDGHLQGLLGFHSNGAVVTWLPLFLFTVLFGLSMDYHVFILSRVKELVDQGVPTDQAVERGIRTTASTVTSAAAVMIAVFAIFASLRTLDIKQLGVGLAIAVLLDATLIRGVLLPAAMKLLGEWNWYLPRWLEWMPRLNVEAELHEDAPEAPPVPVV
ncbi:MAG: MMPL family transporter [Actinobacteria bacterium]|nr:MAG: MMPL family transporter [Actinomycetota bacterium]